MGPPSTNPLLRRQTLRCRRVHAVIPPRAAAAGRQPASPPQQQQQHRARRNPLELLRTTRDPVARANLMQELTGAWREFSEQYSPSDVEKTICDELGLWPYTVMLAATANPSLCALDAATEVRPSLRALKAVSIDPQDIWFLVSRRTHLLSMPVTLQRWLDFLSVYGLKPREMQNFLLRAPDKLFQESTLYQAGLVVAFLKGQLGIRDEYLSARVFCIWPEILTKDVEGSLRPLASYLMTIGLSVSDVSTLVCLWPEVLLLPLEERLKPFVGHLKGLGCTTAQVANVVMHSPHLLGFQPEEVFSGRVQALQALGIGPLGLHTMLRQTTLFLTSTGGIQAQLDFLKAQCFSPAQIRELVLACPLILAEKELELERKMSFVRGTLGGNIDTVLACPQLLGLNLMLVIGPRYDFVTSRPKLLAKLTASGVALPVPPVTSRAAAASSAAGSRIGAGSSTASTGIAADANSGAGATQPAAARSPAHAGPHSIDMRVLLAGDDAAFCEAVGASANEYTGYAVMWEEQYNERLHQASAQEFVEELKKLGIYEGA